MSSTSASGDRVPFPVQVDLDRAGNTLTIVWDDGSTTAYAGERLRWACPCAECRGEAGVPGRLDRLESLAAEELQLEDVGLIGQYALTIAFRSGHSTGIYTFRHLRGLAR
ncbi:MAG TPA: DUF971 domain-containing protein [Candidatus Dormibacteraeota bacterium]